MRTLSTAAALAAALVLTEAAPAVAQTATPPAPERPAPSLMPQNQVTNPLSHGATPAAPPGTGAPVASDAGRSSPASSSPPDTVQTPGGACVHPPCPGAK